MNSKPSGNKEQLLLFDLDGTLFDTKRTNFLAYQEAVSKYGYQIDYEYFCSYCNGRHYLEFLPQITTDDSKILSQMHDLKKAAYPKYLSEAIKNEQLFRLVCGMRDKAYIGLVTTASRQNTNEILDQFHVRELFDYILTREEITRNKPDPEGYVKAMTHFGVGPKQTLIFEDSEVGLEAARRSGADYVRVYGYN